MSTATHYTTPRNAIGVVINMAKYNAYSVPYEGRQKHEQCVYFALDELNLGEECEWATTHALGHVQVMSHYPTGSGYCTTLLSSVLYKNKTRTWRDTACTKGTNNNWTFIGQ